MLSTQLTVDWIATRIKNLCKKSQLVCEPFLVTGNNSNMNGADDHMVGSDIDLQMIFNDEDDNHVFHGSQQRILLLLRQI